VQSIFPEEWGKLHMRLSRKNINYWKLSSNGHNTLLTTSPLLEKATFMSIEQVLEKLNDWLVLEENKPKYRKRITHSKEFTPLQRREPKGWIRIVPDKPLEEIKEDLKEEVGCQIIDKRIGFWAIASEESEERLRSYLGQYMEKRRRKRRNCEFSYDPPVPRPS